MRLKAKQEFTYYLRGVEPVTFAAGDEFDADDQELAEVSQHEGWAVPVATTETTAGPRVNPETQPKTPRRKAAPKE